MIKVVQAPIIEPVSYQQAIEHLRVNNGDDIEYIESLISTAREFVENYVNRCLINRILEYRIERFTEIIELPFQEIISIESIKYFNEENVENTVISDGYFLSENKIYLSKNYTWPTEILRCGKSIVINFIAGYGETADNVPKKYIHAILLLVAHWYENREIVSFKSSLSNIPFAIKSLLDIDRYF